MQAYTYARWSSMEQGAGSTLDRQLRTCREYIDAKGWSHAPESPIIDRGKSAYTGSNIQDGNLGKFAARVASGSLPGGAMLVVEELDRLSRQPPDVMLAWLSPLIRAGLTIVVVCGGQRIDAAMLDTDVGGLMLLLVNAFSSNRESAKKADRVAAAWAKKRRDAAAGLAVQTNHRSPPWVQSIPGGFELVEERADVVRRIFRRRLQGAGKLKIAQELNADKVETFFLTKQRAEIWTATYVGRVIRNRAVVGEWQPMRKSRMDDVARPAGEAITNYYPKIIEEADWQKANDKRDANQRKSQGRGHNLTNLFGPRAVCDICGSPMIGRGPARYHTSVKTGKTTLHYYLYCTKAKLSKDCPNYVGWTYEPLETTILDHLLHDAMDDQAFVADDRVGPAERRVYEIKAEIELVERKKAMLLDMLEDGDSMARDRYRDRVAEAAAARERLEAAELELSEARGVVSPAEHLRRVSEVRGLMKSEDPIERFQARSKVKAALQSIIDRISFIPENGNVKVTLVNHIRSFVMDSKGNLIGVHHASADEIEELLSDEPYGTHEGEVIPNPAKIEAAEQYIRRVLKKGRIGAR